MTTARVWLDDLSTYYATTSTELDGAQGKCAVRFEGVSASQNPVRRLPRGMGVAELAGAFGLEA